MKSKLIILSFVMLGLVALCGPRAARRSHAHSLAPNNPELDALDEVVQKRFHTVIGFGMARMASERQFVPETPEEKEAVKGITRAGYEVCLYLVGRGVLQDTPPAQRVSHTWFGSSFSHTMSGPVFFSKDKKLKAVPDARAIWEPAREAFSAFEKGDAQYSFEADGWQVEARPVHASDESCLRCHGYDTRLTYYPDGTSRFEVEKERNHLRIGDALGIVLYVHKKKTDKP